MDKNKQDMAEGLDLLQEIAADLDKLDDTSPKKEIQAVREGAIERYAKASEFFLSHNQPWLAARVKIMKASLLVEMANGKKAKTRLEGAQTALALVMEVLEKAPDLPPSLDQSVKLQIAAIESLFRIRGLFEEPEQQEGIDELIRAVAETMGEALSMDLLYRREIADLNFTAGILDAMIEVEEDPGVILNLADAAHEIKRQSAVKKMIASPVQKGGEGS
jgi:hypothetical protein